METNCKILTNEEYEELLRKASLKSHEVIIWMEEGGYREGAFGRYYWDVGHKEFVGTLDFSDKVASQIKGLINKAVDIFRSKYNLTPIDIGEEVKSKVEARELDIYRDIFGMSRRKLRKYLKQKLREDE